MVLWIFDSVVLRMSWGIGKLWFGGLVGRSAGVAYTGWLFLGCFRCELGLLGFWAWI